MRVQARPGPAGPAAGPVVAVYNGSDTRLVRVTFR